MKLQGPHLLDESGRTLLLRGCNLGGKPFPLEEAEDRFEQIRSQGFNFVRLSITWESLEPADPGIYDESYVAYLRKLLVIAEKKEILVFMDPEPDEPDERYLAAFRHCYRRLKNCKALTGWRAVSVKFVERMKETGRPCIFFTEDDLPKGEDLSISI